MEQKQKGSLLPTKSEIRELIELLAPLDAEMDELNAEILLEQAGVDLTTLPEQLIGRLEREVNEMRSQGEEVPVALTNVLEALHRESEQDGRATIDPKTWVHALLNKQVPAGFEVGDRPYFRSLRTDLLTEDDIRTLAELYAELHGEDD